MKWLEKGTSAGVQALLTFYLKRQYFISNTAVATTLILWNALSNFSSPCASLAADLYGRFRVISASSILAFLGMGIMWATTLSSKARPPPCYESNDPCEGPNGGQLLLLFTSLFLMGIGGGGIRRCSQTFAADQIMINRPAGAPTISSWYHSGAGMWVIIVVLLLTIAQEEYGWGFGLGAAAVFMLLSLVVFFIASAGYSKLPGGTDGRRGPRRREKSNSRHYSGVEQKESIHVFLNKACLVVNEEKEVNPTTGLPTDPWALCSVEQVEEFKALVKLIPIWLTGVLIAALTSPLTFTSLQAETMKRQFIGRRIQIPESAYGVFTVASSTLLVTLYNLSNKFFVSNAGIPATWRWRMGIGAAFSCTANIVAGAVERIRREKEIFTMSANWLIVQLCLTGLGEGFSAVAHSEFYDSHFVGVVVLEPVCWWIGGQFGVAYGEEIDGERSEKLGGRRFGPESL
ncbi:unnamed protein product [Linum tenue]|uniref:Uncharacterized protein n=1 Tax=Linum tenue TaxID=586396 RepID=A0AAV0N556_9ROSI|nr:unnamed protein product [Linum tenue]